MFGSDKLKQISNIPIMQIKPNTYVEMENEKQENDINGKILFIQ